MNNTLIVLFGEKEIIVQTPEIIVIGVLKIIERNNPNTVVLIKKIVHTDFIQTKVNLEQGKYQVQIITSNETISKNITINNSINQR